MSSVDLLAIAPQASKHLDPLEQALPELPIDDMTATGQVAEKIFDRFGRFFHEFAERRDRDQPQRRDLYSIDRVVPKDRFQTPVRVRVYAQASSPSLAEVDLSSWRPDQEVADRPQIESSAAAHIENLKVTANQLRAPEAYQVLTELAPEFLKEFITAGGLAVNRYWREAVQRAGEPRTDRKTIPIVGPLSTEENTKRFMSVVDYGLRDKDSVPDIILSIAPQAPLWSASTQLRDALSVIRKQISLRAPTELEINLACFYPAKPPRYAERTFDEIHTADTASFPPALELLVVPGTAVAAIVHAPIGAASGYATPLGLASFDPAVTSRAQTLVLDKLSRFVGDDASHARYSRALSPAAGTNPPP